jgi:hypothetical protein
MFAANFAKKKIVEHLFGFVKRFGLNAQITQQAKPNKHCLSLTPLQPTCG